MFIKQSFPGILSQIYPFRSAFCIISLKIDIHPVLHNRSFNPTTNSSVTLFTKYEEIIIFFFKSVRTLFFISLFFHAQKNGSILDQIERFSWIFDTNTVLKITHYLLKRFFLNLKKNQ